MKLLCSIADTLFPPKCIVCDSVLGDEKGPVCKDCHSKINWLDSRFISPELGPLYVDSSLSLAAYDGVWLDVIHNFKYNRGTYLSRPLAALLSRKVDYEYDLIVPVPLHVKRLRSRGYNQSALLTKELEKLCGFKAAPTCLKRIKETKDQVGLTRRERMENVKNAFEKGDRLLFGNAKSSLSPFHDVLLIDDVMTTGATVNECAKVLKRCGALKVDVLTLARTSA